MSDTTSGVVNQPNQSTTDQADYYQLLTDLAEESRLAIAGPLTVFGTIAKVANVLEDGAASGNFIKAAYNEFVVSGFIATADDSIMQTVDGVSVRGISTPPTWIQKAGLQKMQNFLTGIFDLFSGPSSTAAASTMQSLNTAIAQVAAPILTNQSTLVNFLANSTSTVNNFISSLASQVTAVISTADPSITLSAVTAAIQQSSSNTSSDDPIADDPTGQTIITVTDTGEEVFQNVTDTGALRGSTVVEPVADLNGDALYETLDANNNVTSEDWEYANGTSSIITFTNGQPSGANYSGSFGTGTASPLTLISTASIGYLGFSTSIPVTLQNGIADVPNLAALGTMWPGGDAVPSAMTDAKIDFTSDTITITFPTAAVFDGTTPELDIHFPSNVTVVGVALDSTSIENVTLANNVSIGPQDVYIGFVGDSTDAGGQVVLNVELQNGVLVPTQEPPPPPITSGDYYNITTPDIPVTTSGPIGGTTGSIYTVAANRISATIQSSNISPVLIQGNGDAITLGENTADFTITDDGQGTQFLMPFYKGNGGVISIADFQNDKTGVFTLVDQYATPQAVIAALQPDGHGGEILPLSGGTLSLDFLDDTSLTTANFRVGNL
jgi:hypothetical protein